MRCPTCGEGDVYLHRVHRFTRVGGSLGTLLMLAALLALVGGGLSLPRIIQSDDRPPAADQMDEWMDLWVEKALLYGGGGLALGLLLRSQRKYRCCDHCGKKVR